MYEVFLLYAVRTVSLQLVMNVLRWIVLQTVLFVCNLTLLGCDRVLRKTFWGSWKVLEFFCNQESGKPVLVVVMQVSHNSYNTVNELTCRCSMMKSCSRCGT